MRISRIICRSGMPMAAARPPGPMGEAVDASLSYLTPSDIAAHRRVFAHRPRHRHLPICPQPKRMPRRRSRRQHGRHAIRTARVYEGACAGCHGWTGVSPVIPFATLTGTRAVNDPTANNVAQVIIGGGQRHYRRRFGQHAGIRQHLFGCGNRQRRELCDRALRRQGIGLDRGGSRETAQRGMRPGA